MNLEQILEGVPFESWEGPRGAEISNIGYRADAVVPGGLFCTWKGTASDGHRFVGEAVKRGASALVVEDSVEAPAGVARIRVRSGRAALAGMACNYYGHPARRLLMAGVTGTNGKTSTAFALRHLIERSGQACGLLGTIQYSGGSRLQAAARTTPESLELQEWLAGMLQGGCRAVVMEVSSHALDQNRVAGIGYHAAVFTNLTQDHLDYHGTMEKYFEAKAKLFLGLTPGSHAVINLDDSWGRRLAGMMPEYLDLCTYGTAEDADSRAVDIKCSRSGVEFVWQLPEGNFPVKAPWLGMFNISNLLAAATTARALGMPVEEIVGRLASVPAVPGRMQQVAGCDRFTVLVDYAHTDDALKRVLSSLRPLVTGRLLVLAGCGGDRDKTKRPLMARAAAEEADEAVFTSDNPRSEDPLAILKDMESGVAGASNYRVIPDRAEAIRRIIAGAGGGDIVVIAGKGHESTQEIAGIKTPFSDVEVAEKALAAVAGRNS